MTKVVITGSGGFIGSALAEWFKDRNGDLVVDRLSLRDDNWGNYDLSDCGAIVHAAGIAHVKNDKGIGEDYYKINRDLTLELARKCKDAGVSFFVFLSSIIVYGDGRAREALINEETVPAPLSAYGKSKLEAETGLLELADDSFKVAILRLPMVYGKGAKGNFMLLAKLSRVIPWFPTYKNKRSMIYIDNLCLFIYEIIKRKKTGLLFPQNAEYTCTSEMVRVIAEINNRDIKLINGFSRIISWLTKRFNLMSKMFGDLAYDQKLSRYEFDYQIVSLNESLKYSGL